jgi:Outer membrane protein beta-barrel domain
MVKTTVKPPHLKTQHMKQKISSAAPSLKTYLKSKTDVFQWQVFILLLCLAYTGCTSIHESVKGSLELIKVNSKGVSYVDEKDQPEVASDYGFLFCEGLGMGNGSFNVYNKPFSRNSPFLTAGSSNDNIFMPVNFFAAEKKAMKGFWYVSEALDFTNIRTKYSSQGFDYSVKLFYLQIPVLINYSYPLDENNSLHAGFGPYAGIGLSGKFKSDGMERSIKFGSDENNDDLKRMNFGLEINGGFRFMKKWDVTLAYQLGLRNVSTTPPDPDTKIRGLSLSVGYWFH